MPAPKMTSYARTTSMGGPQAPVSCRETRDPVKAPRRKATSSCESADLRRRARKYGVMVLLFIFQGSNSLSIAAPLSQREELARRARPQPIKTGDVGMLGMSPGTDGGARDVLEDRIRGSVFRRR